MNVGLRRSFSGPSGLGEQLQALVRDAEEKLEKEAYPHASKIWRDLVPQCRSAAARGEYKVTVEWLETPHHLLEAIRRTLARYADQEHVRLGVLKDLGNACTLEIYWS